MFESGYPVLYEFCAGGKLQGGVRLCSGGLGRADVCNHDCLRIATQRVLHPPFILRV